MEITKGSLESISRPASSSSERTCSRASSGSLSLITLTDEAPESQDQGTSQENTTINFTGQLHADVTDGDNESELQKAFEEMQRLDDILASKVLKEKEVMAQGRDLKEKLWLELLNKHEKSSECATEAENTRLFLALATVSGPKEEGDFEPVFGTQVPENEYDWDSTHQEQCDREPGVVMKTVRTCGLGQEEEEPDGCEDSLCGAPKSKKKHQDFVKKNIQLAKGSHALTMSQAEKLRLSELLGGPEEEDEEENEDEDSAMGADSEDDVWAVWVAPGQGYTPEPSSMEQLIHIDSTLQLLRSAEGCLRVPSCCTNDNMCQSMSPPPLSEDQLHTLLEECVLTHTEETWDMTPRGSESDGDTEGDHQSLSSLSEALLSELLTDEFTSSFSRLDSNVELCERSFTASTQALHSEDTH